MHLGLLAQVGSSPTSVSYSTPFPWGTIIAVLAIVYFVALTAACALYCWHVAGLKGRREWLWLVMGIFFNALAVVMIGLAPGGV